MKTSSLLPHGGSSVSTQPISNQTFEVFDDDNNGDTSILDGSCRGEGSLLTDWAIVVSPDDEEHLRPHQSEAGLRQPEELEQHYMRPSSTDETKLRATVPPKFEQTHTKQVGPVKADNDVDSIGKLLNKRLEDLVIEDLFLEELLKKSEAKALMTKENTRSDNTYWKGDQSKNHSDLMDKSIHLSNTTKSAKNEKTNTSPDDDDISTIISSLASRKKNKSRTIQRFVSPSKSTVLRMSSQPIILASFPSAGY